MLPGGSGADGQHHSESKFPPDFHPGQEDGSNPDGQQVSGEFVFSLPSTLLSSFCVRVMPSLPQRKWVIPLELVVQGR